jgi:hypothetical protein
MWIFLVVSWLGHFVGSSPPDYSKALPAAAYEIHNADGSWRRACIGDACKTNGWSANNGKSAPSGADPP